MNQLQKLGRIIASSCLALSILTLSGCATGPVVPTDYSAFQRSDPRSILVLPPLNETVDIKGEAAVFSQISYPLAESGYYVFPVGLVYEVFRENGINEAAEAHNVPAQKLIDIFGADTALYLTIKEFGTTYKIVSGDTSVTISGKLVDLKTGEVIWTGSARASSAEQNSNNSGGLAGLLIKAIVNQIVNNLTDRAYSIAGIASNRLLTAQAPRGLLFGPRSPLYTGKRNSVNAMPEAAKQASTSNVKIDPNKTSALPATVATTTPTTNAKSEVQVSDVTPAKGPSESAPPKPTPIAPPSIVVPQPTPVPAPAPTMLAVPAPMPTVAVESKAAEPPKANNVYQPATREIIEDAPKKSNIQLVDFVLGVSSVTVEHLAKAQSCFGGSGAGLVSPKGSRELYKMQCSDGKVLMAKCELRQCTVLSHR